MSGIDRLFDLAYEQHHTRKNHDARFCLRCRLLSAIDSVVAEIEELEARIGDTALETRDAKERVGC